MEPIEPLGNLVSRSQGSQKLYHISKGILRHSGDLEEGGTLPNWQVLQATPDRKTWAGLPASRGL